MSSEKIQAFLDSPCTGHYCDGPWRQWIADILIALEDETEGFSGKRPGNNDSDWWHILADALAEADLLPYEKWTNKWDEEEYVYKANDVSEAWRAVVDHALGVSR